VFCGLSEFQLSLYQLFISSPEIKALLRGTNSQPLKAINILKKLCNHPELLDLPNDLQGSENLIPEGFVGAGGTSKGKNQSVRCEWGGKFLVLERCSSLQTLRGCIDTGRVQDFYITSTRKRMTRSC
jgi:DNA repair and recombination RAD54-like protein